MTSATLLQRAIAVRHARVPRVVPVLLAALAVIAAPVGAQPAPAYQDPSLAQSMSGDPAAGDPLPTRVGRVSALDGAIYHAPPDRASDWDTIGLNYPVTTGDNLWVAEGSRAEVDYGGGQLRIGEATNVNVAELDDHHLGLFVAQGHVVLRVRSFEAGDSVVVDTPSTQLTFDRPGLYDIDVVDGVTTLGVRQGQAQVFAGNGMQPVNPSQSVVVGNDPSGLQYRGALALSPLAQWSGERDRLYDQAQTPYVSRQMVGYNDLAQYGTWQPHADYGNVWFPTTVPAGWAPYSNGYWVDTAGYGLTWVDAAPWGYAPFHYGRWVYVGNRWGWAPGAYVARPAWAPALVAWTGGAGWSVGVNYGGAPVYGWVPLGWRDPYRPWWGGCGAGCWDRYNRPYHVDVTYNNFYRAPPPPPDRYANWRVPGAVVAVPAAALGARQPLARERINLTPAALGAAPALRQPETIRLQPAPVRSVAPAKGAPQPASALYSQSRPAQMGLAAPGPHLRPTSGTATPRPSGAQAPGTATPRPSGAPTPGAKPVQPALPVAPGNAATPGNAVAPPRGPTPATQPARNIPLEAGNRPDSPSRGALPVPAKGNDAVPSKAGETVPSKSVGTVPPSGVNRGPMNRPEHPVVTQPIAPVPQSAPAQPSATPRNDGNTAPRSGPNGTQRSGNVPLTQHEGNRQEAPRAAPHPESTRSEAKHEAPRGGGDKDKEKDKEKGKER